MLLKLHFCKISNRFNLGFTKFKPVVLLSLAFIFSSLSLFAGADYHFKGDQPLIMPELDKTLSENARKKAHALADYVFACLEFKDHYTLSAQSISYFVSAVKNDPEAETPLRILTTYWKRTDNIDSLLKNLLPIARDNPGAVKLNILIASALKSQNRLDDAIALLENSLKSTGIDAKNSVSADLRSKLILQLTQLYALKKDWDKGEELLDTALEVPDLKNLIFTRLAASLFYSECADLGPDGFFAGWDKRRYRKKLESNLNHLENLCADIDFDVMTLFPILDIYKRYSMHKRAEDLILSQLLINPDDEQAFILLAKVYNDNGKYADAFRVWKILVDSPQFANVRRIWSTISPKIEGVAHNLYYQLGDAALKCKNWDEAVKAFDWGLLNDLEDPKGLFKLGFAYMQMGKFKKAIYKFEKVSDIPDAKYFIAHCFRLLGEPAKALAALEAAEMLAKKQNDKNFLSKDFYMEYIYLADKAGDYEKAEEMALKLLKIYPKDPSLNNFLGYSWADRKKNLAEAEKMIRIALDSDKSNSAFLDSMAWVLYRQKKYSSALNYIQDAIEASEEPLPDAVLRDHYGDICYVMGKEQMALKQWQLALETYSDDLDTGKVEKKIANVMKKLKK